MPNKKLKLIPSSPIVSEMRAPWVMRDSMSRPSGSRPNTEILPPPLELDDAIAGLEAAHCALAEAWDGAAVGRLAALIPERRRLARALLAERPDVLVGVDAPDFNLKTHDGGTVQLSDARGSRVVLWFYPKADTPG